MKTDYNQNSPFIYAKDGKRTIKLPIFKTPPDSEHLTPKEVEVKEAQLKELAIDTVRAMEAIERENLSLEQFLEIMRLIYRRLTKILDTTPFALFSIKWAWETCLRNRPDPSTMKHTTALVRSLLHFHKHSMTRPVYLVKPDHFSNFIFHIRVANLYSGSEVNRMIISLRSLGRAIEPFGTLTKGLEFESIEYMTRNPLTVAQIRSLMTYLSKQGDLGREWKTVILLILYTPIRPTAASRLRINQIDFKRRTITYFDKGEWHTAGMCRLLMGYLRNRVRVVLKETGGPDLNPVLSNTSFTVKHGQFVRILKALKIPRPQLKPKYGRRMRYQHCLYDFRHHSEHRIIPSDA